MPTWKKINRAKAPTRSQSRKYLRGSMGIPVRRRREAGTEPVWQGRTAQGAPISATPGRFQKLVSLFNFRGGVRRAATELRRPVGRRRHLLDVAKAAVEGVDRGIADRQRDGQDRRAAQPGIAKLQAGGLDAVVV